MTTWIATDDRIIDGSVEVVPVRNEQGVDGVRVRPREGDLQAFDHFYAELANHPAVPILVRTPGEVIFRPPLDGEVDDLHRFAVSALDAIEASPTLETLSPDALVVGDDGRARLHPRWGSAEELDPWMAIGRALQRRPEPPDPRVEAAIVALLDPSARVRRSARSVLMGGTGHAGRTGEVRYTVAATERGRPASRGRADDASPRAVVAIPASELKQLDHRGRSAAAGLAGLPVAALDGLIAAGLPLVVEGHGRAQPARLAAMRLQRDTGLPIEAHTGGSIFTLLAAFALGTTAAVTGFSAASLALVGLVTLPLIGGLITAGLLAVTGWSLVAWNADRRQLALGIEAQNEAREERERRHQDPTLAAAWNALAGARNALATADLPAAPAADLRGVLGAAERELEQLARRGAVVRRALSRSSSAEVRKRLESVDADDEHQVQRARTLTQTLMELQKLEDEARTIASAAHSLEAVLTEISRSITRWSGAADEQDAIDAVLDVTRRARARANA